MAKILTAAAVTIEATFLPETVKGYQLWSKTKVMLVVFFN
jgi:hypothetical protein